MLRKWKCHASQIIEILVKCRNSECLHIFTKQTEGSFMSITLQYLEGPNATAFVASQRGSKCICTFTFIYRHVQLFNIMPQHQCMCVCIAVDWTHTHTLNTAPLLSLAHETTWHLNASLNMSVSLFPTHSLKNACNKQWSSDNANQHLNKCPICV